MSLGVKSVMYRKIAVITECLIAVVALAACGAPGPPEGIQPVTQGTEPADEVVKLVCEADGSTRLLTPVVTAQEDGVHVRVDNRAREGVSINGLGADFAEGTSEQTISTPPGEVGIACWPYSRHEDEEPPRVNLMVDDPHGYWVNPRLDCPKGDLIGSVISDFVAGAEGEQGDPADLARANLKGVEPSDVIEPAAYPDQTYPVVRVVRDGKTVATASFSPAEAGGWLIGGSEACSSSGITQN